MRVLTSLDKILRCKEQEELRNTVHYSEEMKLSI
jgi:hypothetical protein